MSIYLLLTRSKLLCRRGEIELCARLLGIAAAGLNENPGLLGFVVGAKFALLTVMLPLLAFAGLAYTNGHLVPNSKSVCMQISQPVAVSLHVTDLQTVAEACRIGHFCHVSSNILRA